MFANFAYLDSAFETQNDVNNGNRLTLTPKFSGQPLDDLSAADAARPSAAASAPPTRSSSTRRTRFTSPGYTLVDGLVEYEVNKNLTLRLNVYNLTDEVYIRNVNNNGGRYNPGQPRSVILTSSVTVLGAPDAAARFPTC